VSVYLPRPSGCSCIATDVPEATSAALLAAPFVGSFIGVLIRRLPEGRPVALARSACPSCSAALSPAELIPLFSYLALRGRCRRCRRPIGLFHPMIELAALGVAAWACAAQPDRIWATCILGWTLLALGWVDQVSLLLPDMLTLPLIPAGLAVAWVGDPASLGDHLFAAVLAYLLFAGLSSAYRSLRKRDGLGGGDAKLIAAAGAWCGLLALPFVIFASAVLGVLAALLAAVQAGRFDAGARIPFGPCIAAAFWLAWLYPHLAQQFLGGGP
jgi:leader peptidase (prepilin peptidase)/N-methyltransferase